MRLIETDGECPTHALFPFDYQRCIKGVLAGQVVLIWSPSRMNPHPCRVETHVVGKVRLSNSAVKTSEKLIFKIEFIGLFDPEGRRALEPLERPFSSLPARAGDRPGCLTWPDVTVYHE